MATADSGIYEISLRRRYWLKWLVAALVAALVNAGLFLLLPSLIVSDDSDVQLMEILPSVNVVRLKREETPPKKKQPPPKPEEKKPEEKPIPQKVQTVVPKLSLPFKLSPAMPNAPTSLQFAPMDVSSFNLTGSPDGIDASQLDSALMAVNYITPPYPMRAKRRGIEGWVKVRFQVDEQGRVNNVTIVEADPPDLFNKTVLNTARRWRFKPGTVEGVPVKALGETIVRFELEK